jgi:tetratricopeptide (TPR) repeat protein
MFESSGQLMDDTTLAFAWSVLGRAQFFLGRAALAEQSLARAVDHARQARDRRGESEALQWWAGAKRFGPAHVDEVLDFVEKLAALAQRDNSVEIYRCSFAGVMLAMQGRFAEARASIEEALRWGREHGHEHRRLGTMMESGYVEVLAGDLDAAVERFREGYEGLGKLGETGFRSTIGTLLAEALVELGRDAEAEPILEECEAIAQKDDFDPQARIRQVRAQILARRGATSAAEELAREAVTRYAASDYLDLHARSIVVLAKVIASSGRKDEAASLLADATDLFERKGNRVLAARSRHLADTL